MRFQRSPPRRISDVRADGRINRMFRPWIVGGVQDVAMILSFLKMAWSLHFRWLLIFGTRLAKRVVQVTAVAVLLFFDSISGFQLRPAGIDSTILNALYWRNSAAQAIQSLMGL